MFRNNTIIPLIIECMAMNLHEKDALMYLADKGYKISHDTFYRYRRKIKESRFERLSLIGKTQFVDQHLERISNLELIQKEMWANYRQEKDNFKRVLILEKIADLQQYLSSYYDASRYVMEKGIRSSGTNVESHYTSIKKRKKEKELNNT